MAKPGDICCQSVIDWKCILKQAGSYSWSSKHKISVYNPQNRKQVPCPLISALLYAFHVFKSVSAGHWCLLWPLALAQVLDISSSSPWLHLHVNLSYLLSTRSLLSTLSWVRPCGLHFLWLMSLLISCFQVLPVGAFQQLRYPITIDSHLRIP